MDLAYFVYILLLLVMSYLGYQYSMTNKKVFLYAIIAIFTFVIGFRYAVGTDYLAYKAFYFNHDLFHKEYGYTFINNFFSFCQFHYSTLFVFISFLEIYFFIQGFKNFNHILPWAVFFLFTTLELFIWNNGLRQSVAFCIFFYAIRFIHERKPIQYVLCILLAGSMHKSAYPLVAFYMMPYLKVKDDRWIQYVLFFGTFLAGTFLKTFFFANITGVANLIGLGENVSNIKYLETLNWGGGKNSLGVASLMWMLIDIFCIYLYPKLKKKYDSVGFDLYYKLYIIGILLQNSIGGTYFDRMNMYFLPFRIVIYSFFMYEFSKKKDVVYRVPILLFCGLTFGLFLWAINNKAANCAPYLFVFDQ